MNFSQLGLAAPLLKALEGEGYVTPTPIQAQAIPAVMGGADLLGIAQTGTGKTAAFALPILHRLAADPRPAMRKGSRVLVLSPTRELASQIGESFRTYGRHLGTTVAVVFGGVAHRPQIQALARGVDVLVATPGRLLDHLGERTMTVSGTEIFVLDEADQMLDLGFVKPIRTIVGQLTQKRQNLFFSATMPREIAGLADDLLREPVKIAVTPVATTAERVSQRVIHIEHAKKRTLLAGLLADPEMSRTLVFTRTKRGADRVAKHLETVGIMAAAIHGNKSQKQREQALDAFRRSKIRVLVATDIAARGIDIDGVSHVINYELPEVPEAYVHRIGRTARAGAAGSAISLCDIEERDLLRGIERLTRQSIPSENRCNDPSIAGDPGTPRASREDQRGEGRGRGGNGRGNGRSGNGRSAGGREAHGRDGGNRGFGANGRSANGGRTADGRSSESRPARTYDPLNQDSPARTAEGRDGNGRSAEGRNSRGHVGQGRGPNERTGDGRDGNGRSAHGRDASQGQRRPNGGERGQGNGQRRDDRPQQARNGGQGATASQPASARSGDAAGRPRTDSRPHTPNRGGDQRANGSARASDKQHRPDNRGNQRPPRRWSSQPSSTA
jgi:ATP-dependent RNA helicase RhlE